MDDFILYAEFVIKVWARLWFNPTCVHPESTGINRRWCVIILIIIQCKIIVNYLMLTGKRKERNRRRRPNI